MACTVDFRCLDEGFGGKTNKRKRERESQEAAEALADGTSMEIDGTDPPSSKRIAVASSENPDKPVSVSLGKPTYDGVIAGKVSGRTWKQVRTHRASARFVKNRGPDLEEMKRQREIKKAYKERINELKEEIRSNKVEKRKKKEEREKKKAENVLRSGTKYQKITNPKTLKKIMKSKQRKHLKVLPDDVANGGGIKKTSKNQ